MNQPFHQLNQNYYMNALYNPKYPYNYVNETNYYTHQPNMINDQMNFYNQFYPQSFTGEISNEIDADWQENIEQYVSPFIQYFKDENGEIDIDKVFGTVTQLMKTAQQIGPIVQSVNQFVKNIRN